MATRPSPTCAVTNTVIAAAAAAAAASHTVTSAAVVRVQPFAESASVTNHSNKQMSAVSWLRL